MKIKIFNDAKARYIRSHSGRTWSIVNWSWADYLETIQGKILDVETDHLFADQFNTAPHDFGYVLPEHKSKECKELVRDCYEFGSRIMAESVEAVIDDIRIGMMRCHWCGQTQPASDNCLGCDRDEYLNIFQEAHHVVLSVSHKK